MCDCPQTAGKWKGVQHSEVGCCSWKEHWVDWRRIERLDLLCRTEHGSRVWEQFAGCLGSGDSDLDDSAAGVGESSRTLDMAGNVRLEDMGDGPVAEVRTGSDTGTDSVRKTQMKRLSLRLDADNTRTTVAPSSTHASYQSLANDWDRNSHQRLGLQDIAPDGEPQSHCWELGLAEHLAGRNSSSIGSRDY